MSNRHDGENADDNLKRRPSPQDDDILSDSSLEDLDLASLIGDTPRQSVGSFESEELATPQLVDDGELDLLGDEAEEIRADDLLDEAEPHGIKLEDVDGPIVLVSSEEAEQLSDIHPGIAGNGAQEVAQVPPPPAGELSGAIGVAVSSLGRDGKGPGARGPASDRIQDAVSDGGEPFQVEGESSSGVTRSAASRSGEGDLGVDNKDDDKDNKDAGKAGKPSKRFGKLGKKAKPAEESEGASTADPKAAEPKSDKKEKAKKAKVKPSRGKPKSGDDAEAARPAAFTGSVRGSVAFVCSECYEEFLLPANYSQEMVCCPECLHVGKRPDADFLRTVNRHKAGERKSLTIAIVAGAVVVGLVLYLLWLSSDMYVAQHGRPDKNLVMGLLGGSVLLGAMFIWLSVKAEGNRWEVYF